jgi:hypothetical protein
MANETTERMRTEIEEKISGLYKSINEINQAIERLQVQ